MSVMENEQGLPALFSRYKGKDTQPGQVDPMAERGLDPRTFSQEFPVERPDVPDIEEQLPPEASDGSLISGFFNVMDNIVPDDMGGLIRGTSGWLSKVPGYQETVGTVAGGALSGGSAVINAINWGSEQMNHLGAALMSAMPGGIQTLDWEQSQDISLGQVVTANTAINSRNGAVGWLINAATSGLIAIPAVEIGKAQDPQNVLYSKDFDILDPEQRKEAFESGGMGQFSSGFADAIWMVAADPTILGGKATSILRLGTKTGEFGGLTNQALRNARQVERFGSTLDEQALLIKDLGVDGARSSGRLTAEGENLIRAMEQSADELANHVWVSSSPNKRDTRAILGATSIDDPETAAAVAGAMAGRAASWMKLRERSVELYDATARALGVDVFAPVGTNVEDFATAGVRLSDDQIRLGDDYVYEVLSAQPELLASGQLIKRGGSRIGPRSVRAANAWRAGATQSQFVNNAFKKSSSSASPGKGHFVYDTIEGISGSRPVEVIRWLGRGTPTGIVFVKDGADGASSLDEVSAFLRKSPLDQDTSARYLNEFAAARTVAERTDIIRRIEMDAITALAARRGLSRLEAEQIYNKYAQKRATALEMIGKSETKFYVDPDTNKLVKVPDFYAELDQAYPMVDLKMFDRVISGKPWLRYGEDVSLAADYLNSLWKVSVLLRLGYTQRNLAEGAMRSFAVLGLIAANPRAWVDLPANAVYYAKARKGIKGLRQQEQRLAGVYEDLRRAQSVYDDALFASGIRQIEKLQEEVVALRGQITKIRGRGPAGPQLPAKTLTKKQEAQVAKLEKRQKKLQDKIRTIRTEQYEPSIAEVQAAERARNLVQAEVDDLSQKVLTASAEARAASAKRRIGGRRKNIIDGIEVEGAFTGQDGAIALLASSADRTAYMTFDAAVGKRIEALERSADFRRLDPKKLTTQQMQSYWDEYAIRINNRYRSDPIGKRILANEPVDDIKAWLRTPEGTLYRQQLSQRGRMLDTEQAIDEYIDNVVRRLDYEMPRDTPLRSLALQNDVSPGEVMAALSGRDLPVLVGRVADDMDSGILSTTYRGVNTVTGKLMRWLGSVPETKMLRHPFYRNIFDAEQRNMWRLAADQGVDVTNPAVQNRIAKSAHREALKATRETMYTIDRLSNAAQMLRFVSPFFPAWENSIRTWGRIAWNNPAIIGYGNLLWNIPNNLGLVVDENGDPVDRSNMLKDEGYFIVWPEVIQKFAEKELNLGPIPITPGQRISTRQQAFNVILPGAEWWFSGLGPAATIPTAWFLRGKPEDAEVLRNAVGDEMYRQIVPGASPNVDLFDALLPTAARRARQWLNGESTDSAFVRTWNQIIEDEYIKAQLENRTLTDADMKRIKRKADRFWAWQWGAAVAAPAQSGIRSEFQVERDAWNKLIDDESMPYQEKLRVFNEQFPGFEAITRSTSESETGLSPNLRTWQRITSNKETVDKLYSIDPELVGMFGNMGRFDDPFSYAVYGEFGRLKLGPTQVPVRRRLTPDEIVRNNEIKDGWADYWAVKDYVEDKAISLGYSSLQVQDAKPLRDELEKAEAKISERYPAWGEERRIYESKLEAFIVGARTMVENAELVNEDSTIAALADYLQVREEIVNALDGVTDRDQREALRQIGYKAAFDLRQRDIGFADFYDQYLSRDDFRKV